MVHKSFKSHTYELASCYSHDHIISLRSWDGNFRVWWCFNNILVTCILAVSVFFCVEKIRPDASHWQTLSQYYIEYTSPLLHKGKVSSIYTVTVVYSGYQPEELAT
jgi:hypothetical protein